jgi:tetratricopeptide (TPR) repeat protein
MRAFAPLSPRTSSLAYTHTLPHRYAELEAAEALYRRGASASPPCPRAAYRLGALLHHILDRPAEAGPWYRLAADAPGAPPDAAAPALVGLGLLLADAAGDNDAGADAAFEEARDLFDRAAELAPDDPAPQFFCGALLHERGEVPQARAAYRRAIDCPAEPRRADAAGAERR